MQCEDGSFAAILPREDLEAIHSRILASELVVKGTADGASDVTTQQGRFDASRPPLNVRLAAALGLTPLLLPFRRVLTLQMITHLQCSVMNLK